MVTPSSEMLWPFIELDPQAAIAGRRERNGGRAAVEVAAQRHSQQPTRTTRARQSGTGGRDVTAVEGNQSE
jgi:hypothetical protein